MKIYYVIKKPGAEGRKAKRFLLLQKTVSPEGSKYDKVSSPQMDSINKQLDLGVLTVDQALEHVKAFKDSLARRPQVNFHKDNLKIVEAFLASKRSVKDEASRISDYTRSVAALGTLPLTSSKEELQQALKQKFRGNAQRRRAQRINELLRFIGRADRLWLEEKEHRLVNYVSLADVLDATTNCPEWLEALTWVLFGTGMRIGEAFALQQADCHPSHVRVRAQITKEGHQRLPKNKKIRDAPIIKEARSYIAKWLALRPQVTRTVKAMDTITPLFVKAIGKQIHFHDLRHSYAIHLLVMGNSLTQVARCLGDSESVAQMHYAGFALVAEELKNIKT